MKAEVESVVETTKGPSQEVIVVVSLVRTLTSSFGSALDLYRKLKRRTTHEKNSKCDGTENYMEGRHPIPLRRRRDSASDHTWSHHHHLNLKSGLNKGKHSDNDEEDIGISSYLIQTEYDHGYRELGETFARGDLITQVQLQAQIIRLEQTILSIYEDLMLSTYIVPSHTHLARLVQTTRSTRTAVIQSLKTQYQRMRLSIKPEKPDAHRPIPGAFPNPIDDPRPHQPPSKKDKSKRKARSRSSGSSSSAQTVIPRPKPNPHPHVDHLFCIYAKDLQRNSYLPLADNYKAGGDNHCPFCRTYVSIRPGKAWEVVVDDRRKHHKRGRFVFRKFLVDNRFVIKCHREWGGFACVLCAQFKEEDTVCRSIGALIEHLWKEHTSEELAKDKDIVEID